MKNSKPEFIKADKQKFLEWLEQTAEERRDRDLEPPLFESEYDCIKEIIRNENGQHLCPMEFNVYEGLTEGGHDPHGTNAEIRHDILKCFLKYIENPKRKIIESSFYLNKLNEAFNECNHLGSEIVLKSTPSRIKGSKDYTLLLDQFLTKLYDDVVISQRPWQPCKAAVVEQMCCHHPNKEIRITGLEILVSNDIGSGVGDNDIGFEICQITNCKWIFTSYLNAQDAEGYRVPDPFCPVHGNKFYNDEARKKLFEKWKKKDYETLLLKA